MNSAERSLSIVAIVAFVMPLALGASPAGAQTTTTSPSLSISTTSIPTSTTGTAGTTPSSTTSTTQIPTSTTASPPATDLGVVAIGANGNTIHAEGALDAHATGDVLAQTGISPMRVWLTGVTFLISGAFASTFNRRRHLNLYVLRSSKRS